MSVLSKRLREPDNGYITMDRSGIINSCNNRAARTIGHPREDLLGKHLPTLLEADKRFAPLTQRLKKPVESIKNEQFFLAGSQHQPLNNLTVRIVVIPDGDNNVLGIYIGLIDRSEAVTPRLLALDSIAEGVFTVDGDMKITSFNAAAERMTGWTQEEVLGKPCKIIFQSNICMSSCAISSCIINNTNIVQDRNVYIYRKDGTPFPVSVSAAPLIDSENHVIGGVETFRDISETVKSDIIIDAVADGVVTFNDKGFITSFNSGAERITGWIEEDVVGRLCDELFFAADGVSACPITASKSGEPCNIIDQEGFVTDKDGFNIPIVVSITPMLDDKNRPIGCVQTFRDNTIPLQNKLILDSIADGVFTVDRNWRITSFNMAAEVITGWEREDAIGKFCSDVFHSSICGKNCAIAESLYSGRPVSNRSIVIEDIDGKSKPISISASPLVDVVGNVVGGVETFRDLTVMESLRKQLMQRYTFDEIISKSTIMQRLFQILPISQPVTARY